MKTPMQHIKDLIEVNGDHPVIKQLIVNWISDNMDELMLTEREIIETAFLHGWGLSSEDDFTEYVRDYYNEKFNTKEQ